jgi:hypothetical protein
MSEELQATVLVTKLTQYHADNWHSKGHGNTPHDACVHRGVVVQPNNSDKQHNRLRLNACGMTKDHLFHRCMMTPAVTCYRTATNPLKDQRQ